MHVVVGFKLLAGLAGIWPALVFSASGCHIVVIRTVSNSQFEIDLQDRGFISSIQKELGASRTRGQARLQVRERSDLALSGRMVPIHGARRLGRTYLTVLLLGANNSRHPSIIHDKLTIEITTKAEMVSIQRPRSTRDILHCSTIAAKLLFPLYTYRWLHVRILIAVVGDQRLLYPSTSEPTFHFAGQIYRTI